jgi:hypothetical protein
MPGVPGALEVQCRIQDRETGQGGRVARPVPDRAYAWLSAATFAAVSMFAFAGFDGARPPAMVRVIPVPAVVPAVPPTPVPAKVEVRPWSMSRRHECRRPVSVIRPVLPVMLAEAKPGEHRTQREPRPHSRPRRRRVGRAGEQQQKGCYRDETALHDCSFDGDHSRLSTALQRLIFRR